MRPTRPIAVLAAGVLAAAVSAQRLHAYDLTGTWTGKYVCQTFDGTKFKSGNASSTFLITQVGSTVYANLDDGAYLYNGGAIPDAAKPEERGELALIQCPTDNLPLVGDQAEIIRARVKVQLDAVTGTLKGASIYESGIPEVGSCKYSYKRTNTTNPNVGACL